MLVSTNAIAPNGNTLMAGLKAAIAKKSNPPLEIITLLLERLKNDQLLDLLNEPIAPFCTMLDTLKNRSLIELLKSYGAKNHPDKTAAKIVRTAMVIQDLPLSETCSEAQATQRQEQQEPFEQLLDAIMHEQLERIEEIIRHEQIDINTKSRTGKLPLQEALSHNRPRAVGQLLQLGARPNIFDGNKQTAWSIAAENLISCHHLMKLLVDQCGQELSYYTDDQGNNPLHYIERINKQIQKLCLLKFRSLVCQQFYDLLLSTPNNKGNCPFESSHAEILKDSSVQGAPAPSTSEAVMESSSEPPLSSKSQEHEPSTSCQSPELSVQQALGKISIATPFVLETLPETFKRSHDIQASSSTVTPDTCRAYFGSSTHLESLFIEAINQESSSICITAYMITNRKISQALLQALKNRNVMVNIVIDFMSNSYPENNKILKKLILAGAQIKTLGPTLYMHSKFIIFHAQNMVIAGSANCSFTGLRSNYEHVIVSRIPTQVDTFKRAFFELFQKAQVFDCANAITSHLQKIIQECKGAGNVALGEEIELQLEQMHQQILTASWAGNPSSADSSTVKLPTQKNSSIIFENRKQSIISLINRETSWIAVAAFTLTDPELIEALKKAAQRNVNIFIMVDANNGRHAHIEEAFLFMHNHVAIKKYTRQSEQDPTLMHHKFMIFGSKNLAINGSCNFSPEGLLSNVEFLMLNREPHIVDEFKNEFYKLWQPATSSPHNRIP